VKVAALRARRIKVSNSQTAFANTHTIPIPKQHRKKWDGERFIKHVEKDPPPRLFNSEELMRDELYSEHFTAGASKNVVLAHTSTQNAITAPLLKRITALVNAWSTNNTVHSMVFKGEGGFLTGGYDWNAIVEGTPANNFTHQNPRQVEREKAAPGTPFERFDWTVRNACLTTFAFSSLKKPSFAILNGAALGGASGPFLSSSFPIATERALFAVTETSLGVPLTGGLSQLLANLNDSVGVYLALTGFPLSSYDLVHAGLCSHFVSSSRVRLLEERLNSLYSTRIEERVVPALEEYEDALTEPYSLHDHLDVVRSVFSLTTLDAMLLKLEQSEGAFAQKVLTRLREQPRHILLVNLQLLNHARTHDMASSLRAEHVVAHRIASSPHFFPNLRDRLAGKTVQWTEVFTENLLLPLANRNLALRFPPIDQKEVSAREQYSRLLPKMIELEEYLQRNQDTDPSEEQLEDHSISPEADEHPEGIEHPEDRVV